MGEESETVERVDVFDGGGTVGLRWGREDGRTSFGEEAVETVGRIEMMGNESSEGGLEESKRGVRD